MNNELTLYAYRNCDTCRKAKRFLDAQGIAYKEKAIRETPPSKAELKEMLIAYQGELKKLFNTSGQDYRKMGIKDSLPDMSESDAIQLLTQHGNLVKRPFLIGSDTALVGFKEDTWKDRLVGG